MRPGISQSNARPALNVYIPPAFKPFFAKARYKVAHGGRGSAKSWTFAKMLVFAMYASPVRCLCAREFQNSIADSVHKLIVDQIEAFGLSAFFTVTRDSIKSSAGAECIFKGLRHNPQEVKSLEGIDICWVEEAQRVSKESWDILIPTIRKEGSEFWITFNPDGVDDPTYVNFVINQRANSIVRQINYTDNPFFPETLREEMEFCKRIDIDAYNHIWLGEPKSLGDAVIFKGRYSVESFETPANVDRFYFGADWGFSADPTTLVRSFIKDRKLYIDYEAYGVGVDLDEIPELFRSVPESDKWPIWADCSRPETVSIVKRYGFNISSADKWSGCVEDGIAYMRGNREFESIVVHERCKHAIQEFKLYSYKIDKVTSEPLPIVVSKHDHVIDAVRYSLNGYVKKKTATRQANVQFMRR